MRVRNTEKKRRNLLILYLIIQWNSRLRAKKPSAMTGKYSKKKSLVFCRKNESLFSMR